MPVNETMKCDAEGSDMAEAAKIVIIDDHRVLAGALKSALNTACDLNVAATADTVAGGLDAVARFQPDAVVTDYRLPDGDIAEHIPTMLEAAPRTKVLVLTGWADESSFLRSIRAGAAGFFDKQQGIDDLIDAVRRVLRGELVVAPHLVPLLAQRAGAPISGTAHAASLTPRELDVLQLLADGVATRQIATRLNLSAHTIRNHVAHLLGKLDAHSRLEAVRIGVDRGLIRLDRAGP